MAAGEDRTELLKGTLDLLVLRTLATGPRHGLGVSRRIEETRRKARYYTSTKPGRRQLESETRDWRRTAQAVARVLRSA
jgi:DNA-binding PadR family transcriptional regulator